MLVLSVKKIKFALLGTFAMFMLIAIAISLKDDKLEYVDTVSLPVSGKIVVVDAGHGVPDEGAEVGDGTTEAQTNLKIALKLQNLLEQSGCVVILTRSDENGIYDLDAETIRQKKVSDMKNRANIGNNSNAEIFVSIHLNKIPSSKYSGWQTFYKDGVQKSLDLANSIQENLNYTIQKENKRVPEKISDIYLSKKLEIPFTIVECGFLSNSNECELLQTDEYQDILSWGIYTGIMDYFNQNE